jgi:hypothetical protein
MTSAPVKARINEALPEDIFGMIFEEHAKLEWRAPLIDGGVCRQWQQTILRSPRAWVHLDIVEKMMSTRSMLRRWLDRSGAAPLHIKAFERIRGEEEVVDQHHKRIGSMELSSHSKILATFENRSFPILQSINIKGWDYEYMVPWSAWRAMPELRSLRAGSISLDDLPSNAFPQLRVLALCMVDDCDCIIQSLCHSLTSLMLAKISLQYASEFLEFPSLRFLSLFAVENIKHRMNVPALTTFHESCTVEEFPMPLPTLVEYGIHRTMYHPPLNVTRIYQYYPNISRLSVRDSSYHLQRFIHSLCSQPTPLPMLRILATDPVYNATKIHSMMNDVLVRNMASSVKMELCLDGRTRVPLYFEHTDYVY